jgi:hypothetical protein
MAEPSPKPQNSSQLPELESEQQRAEIYRPVSLLRSTEWGLLTVGSLLAALAFPPYFVTVLWLAFFNAGGLLWVTHLSESGRKRLKEFEKEFSKGHELESAGEFERAAEFYASLIPQYQDFPKIAEIASRRVQHLKDRHAKAFPAKARKKPRRGGS